MANSNTDKNQTNNTTTSVISSSMNTKDMAATNTAPTQRHQQVQVVRPFNQRTTTNNNDNTAQLNNINRPSQRDFYQRQQRQQASINNMSLSFINPTNFLSISRTARINCFNPIARDGSHQHRTINCNTAPSIIQNGSNTNMAARNTAPTQTYQHVQEQMLPFNQGTTTNNNNNTAQFNNINRPSQHNFYIEQQSQQPFIDLQLSVINPRNISISSTTHRIIRFNPIARCGRDQHRTNNCNTAPSMITNGGNTNMAAINAALPQRHQHVQEQMLPSNQSTTTNTGMSMSLHINQPHHFNSANTTQFNNINRTSQHDLYQQQQSLNQRVNNNSGPLPGFERINNNLTSTNSLSSDSLSPQSSSSIVSSRSTSRSTSSPSSPSSPPSL